MHHTTDPAKLDFPLIHAWIAASYWSPDIPVERFRRAIDNSSIVASTFLEPTHDTQLAFLRVVTDYTRFAYLMDVIVHPDHRGHGIGSALLSYTFSLPQLQDIDTWCLATDDAQPLYQKFGFSPTADPNKWMFKKRDRS